MLQLDQPVCLVEDQPHDLFTLQQQVARLSDTAPEIVSFSTLEEALSWGQNHKPQLLICDLNLPDSSGLTTLRKLRAALPTTPIVVLSGMGDEELGNQAIAEGAQDYLVKGSFNLEVLGRTVRYAMSRMKSIQELEAAKNRAETSERVMQEFLTNVSHEMRTPMNVIAGMADLLQDSPLNNEQRE